MTNSKRNKFEELTDTKRLISINEKIQIHASDHFKVEFTNISHEECNIFNNFL